MDFLHQVRRSIGVAVIEENDSIFQEANALSEILGDVQTSTNAVMQRHRLCMNPQRNMASWTAATTCTHPYPFLGLPQPRDLEMAAETATVANSPRLGVGKPVSGRLHQRQCQQALHI